jgi:endonuclease YncB( thermonuclease family)
MRLAAISLALLLATPAFAGTRTPEPVHGPIRVIDGDTVRLSSGEIVRIYNIDAPETHKPRCPAELTAGYVATAYLNIWLKRGGVTISRCEPATGRCEDRYGRTLATLSVASLGDIGNKLISVGAALPWRPGRAARDARVRRWCGGEID